MSNFSIWSRAGGWGLGPGPEGNETWGVGSGGVGAGGQEAGGRGQRGGGSVFNAGRRVGGEWRVVDGGNNANLHNADLHTPLLQLPTFLQFVRLITETSEAMCGSVAVVSNKGTVRQHHGGRNN